MFALPVIAPAASRPGDPARSEPADAALRSEVARLLATLRAPARVHERRRHARLPFPGLVYLTPIEAPAEAPAGPAAVGAGNHLSEGGLGFFHPEPILHRQVIVTFDVEGSLLSLRMELRWCRFIRHGWYESGGRFLGVAPTPLRSIRSYAASPSPWR